jgi:hypothetical protein
LEGQSWTIGWFARDPCILHRVGEVLLPAAAGGLKQTRQTVFVDDCFQLLKVSNQKTVHAIKMLSRHYVDVSHSDVSFSLIHMFVTSLS